MNNNNNKIWQPMLVIGIPLQQKVKAKLEKKIHRKQSQEFKDRVVGSFNTGARNTPHCGRL